MITSVFVLSDLHLGGAEGFRMCSAAAVDRLAEFLRWIAEQRDGSHDVHLVIDGDVVDFLAERDRDSPPEGKWSAFTADQVDAIAKLDRIIESSRPFWEALGLLLESGVEVTQLIGNHDEVLALPAVRKHYLRAVAPRGGRFLFLYDNEAFTLGKLIVEHGNRYDGWNAVDHDALRRVRSALSRRQEPQVFPAQPGSEMVARVMNRIKSKYAFVDLLKPETSAVAPILAVLNPALWKMASGVLRQAVNAARRATQTAPAGPPAKSGLVAGSASNVRPPPSALQDQEEGMRLADELSIEVAATTSEKVGFVHELQLDLLLRAFRHRREQDRTTFAVDVEADRYLDAATSLAARGFQVVVFGHTHHAKRIPLPGGAMYLNSGTWADLMRIPDVVYEGDKAAGIAALREWLEDLEANRVDRYRRFVPTFIRVDVEANGEIAGADACFFDGPDKVAPIATAAIAERLGLR